MPCPQYLRTDKTITPYYTQGRILYPGTEVFTGYNDTTQELFLIWLAEYFIAAKEQFPPAERVLLLTGIIKDTFVKTADGMLHTMNKVNYKSSHPSSRYTHRDLSQLNFLTVSVMATERGPEMEMTLHLS